MMQLINMSLLCKFNNSFFNISYSGIIFLVGEPVRKSEPLAEMTPCHTFARCLLSAVYLPEMVLLLTLTFFLTDLRPVIIPTKL